MTAQCPPTWSGSGPRPVLEVPARPGLGRPPALGERAGQFLLRALSPSLPKIAPAPPPAILEPAERFFIPRRQAKGELAATWFPAPGRARGIVVLAHPWHGRGQAYFHRHRRIPSLRDAGYHVLTFDFGGVGGSGGVRRQFPDRDVADVLAAVHHRSQDLPIHLWGVCLGGYWAHLAVLGRPEVRSALFEDVTFHPLAWSRRKAPWGRPAYAFFERALPSTYHFLDLRRQASGLALRPTAWISGAWNTTVLPEETRQLAGLAGGEALIVEDADHLECMRRGRRQVVELALETFERSGA